MGTSSSTSTGGSSRNVPEQKIRVGLKPGDHIYAFRRKAPYAYAHHGIYVGDDEVIHFLDDSSVEKTSLGDFLSGHTLFVVSYSKSSNTNEVIHRAEYLLEHGFGKYNLATNNCETFAIYCKTGLVKLGRFPIDGEIKRFLRNPAISLVADLAPKVKVPVEKLQGRSPHEYLKTLGKEEIARLIKESGA